LILFIGDMFKNGSFINHFLKESVIKHEYHIVISRNFHGRLEKMFTGKLVSKLERLS
jgi:hypothetical protein